jgi:hypothetical protein
MGGPSSTLVAGVLLVVVAVGGLLYNEIVSSSQGRLAAVEKMNRHLREELERCERDHRWRDARMPPPPPVVMPVVNGHVPVVVPPVVMPVVMPVVNGHVPVADGYLPQEYPLPSLNGRIPFPDADYGDCQPFMVPHGRVYGKLQPSQEDRVGHRWPGRVFVRCNRGFELRSGSNPDRMCLSVEGASSWSPGGGDWANSICVAATPAMLSPTATFGQNEHLRCLAGLVKSFPAAGGMPAGGSNDHRVAALECLGCRRVPSNVDNDCSVSGRLFELADVDCTRLETLGSADAGRYCILPRIMSQPDPCVVLAVGVGFVWDVEYDVTMRWNCTTYMFDPTPGSGLGQPRNKVPSGYRKQYDMSTQHRPFGNWMEKSGIAATDTASRMEGSAQFGQSKSAVSFLTIATMLSRIGHKDGRRIALFKLDVEGYEFGVLDQVLEQRFPYINIDFHTWDHVKLSNALHAFNAAGYKIIGIDMARLDDRKQYGMLIHMEFALVQESNSP